GKTVADVSLNAVANLGYADGRFQGLVWPGETLEATSTVLGIKENSSRQTGVVWVRTTGRKTSVEAVLEYVRWVMVRRRGPTAVVIEAPPPELPASVPARRLAVPAGLRVRGVDPDLTGSPWVFEDYAVGERIDHVDGMGVMESEH